MYIVISFKVHILQQKWRDVFDFEDVNNDSVLDMTDVELCTDSFIRLHNLTAEEVCGQTCINVKQERADEALCYHSLISNNLFLSLVQAGL